MPVVSRCEFDPIGGAGQREHRLQAALAQEHLLVLDAVGEERHRHEIALGAGDLGQTVDDVERVCGGVAGEAAEQRDEPHLRPRRLGQVGDDGGQRAAVADADQRGATCFEHTVQPVPTGAGQCRQRQGAVLDRGRHRAELELPSAGDPLLERDALRGRALDEHVDEPGPHRLPDQPVDLDPRHAEPLRDLLLGVVAHVGEPRRARREAELVGLQPALPDRCA
jgi:hypothetical protein